MEKCIDSKLFGITHKGANNTTTLWQICHDSNHLKYQMT